MVIIYADEIGTVEQAVDESGVSFYGGRAYFSDGEQDYNIPVASIKEIV